jgi:hypothetical protein
MVSAAVPRATKAVGDRAPFACGQFGSSSVIGTGQRSFLERGCD